MSDLLGLNSGVVLSRTLTLSSADDQLSGRGKGLHERGTRDVQNCAVDIA